MYEQFYGLRESPFALTPNPRFLVLTPNHLEALSNIEYGITSRRGITLLLGEAGTGKTTVVRQALAARIESGGPRLISMYLNHPTLTCGDFMEFLAAEFCLNPQMALSKTGLLREIERVLRLRRDAGDITVLVIDEAQSLPDELLEEIRLLANIECATEKLLPLVLAGQPELASRLNEPKLWPLKQRVALRCTLGPLSLQETASYIAARIRRAGGEPGRTFSRNAVMAVHEHARGIPRIITVICDNALLNGFALQRRPVDADLILEVCRDFDLRGRSLQSSPASDGQHPAPTPKLPPMLPASAWAWPAAARRFSQRLVGSR